MVDFGSWVCGFDMGLCLIWVLYGFPICGGGGGCCCCFFFFFFLNQSCGDGD